MWGQGFGPAAGLLPGADAYVSRRAARKHDGSPEGLAPHGLSTERLHVIPFGGRNGHAQNAAIAASCGSLTGLTPRVGDRLFPNCFLTSAESSLILGEEKAKQGEIHDDKRISFARI